MGLQAKYSAKIAPDSGVIKITETTGVYHATNNPTGWYGVNPDPANAQLMTVRVRRPDPTTLRVSSDPAYETTIDMLASGFPNIIGTEFEINPEDVGLSAGDKFIDGEYEFFFTVSRTSATAFSSTYKLGKIFYANLACCAKQKMAAIKLNPDCTDCKDEISTNNKLQLALKSVMYNNGCGKLNQALESLKIGQDICSRDGCSGC